jgi:biotin operon repressor/ribosomal protein L13E
MRAAKAAKDIKHTVKVILHPLAQVLEDALASDSSELHQKYLEKTVLPLLTGIAAKVCNAIEVNPYIDAAVSMLDMCCTDDVVKEIVHAWSKDGAYTITPAQLLPDSESQKLQEEVVACVRQEEAEAQADVAREQEADEVTFYFVDAKYLRNTAKETVPSFQQLKRQPNVLIKRVFSRGDAYRRKYEAEYLAVSHRWERSEEPDVEGVQFASIKDFLSKEGAGIKYVWFDFWCMPQGKRTPAETVYFKWMLLNVNLLYLGTKVLLLVDISYVSRFWTQFEAWLSLQTTTSTGLCAAPPRERRSTIKCIHNATSGSEDAKLLSMWSTATPEDAQKVLRSHDVVVTNQGDKDVQLEKTAYINDEVREAFSVRALIALHSELAPTPGTVRKMGFSCQVMQEGGYTLPQLREAGYTVAELFQTLDLCIAQYKDAGYSLWEISNAVKPLGYDDEQLRKAGFTALELKQAGYLLFQIQEAGYTLEAIKDAGFKAGELRANGYSLSELLEVGSFTVLELKRAGFTARDFRAVGYTPDQLMVKNIFTIQDIRGACFPLEYLRPLAKRPVAELIELGLASSGYTARQLKEASFSAKVLRSVGFAALELMEANFDRKQLDDAGVSHKDIQADRQHRHGSQRATSSNKVLQEGAYSAWLFKDTGVGLRLIQSAGHHYTVEQLKKAGYTAAQFKEAGHTYQSLRQAGFTQKEMKEAGYESPRREASPKTTGSFRTSFSPAGTSHPRPSSSAR